MYALGQIDLARPLFSRMNAVVLDDNLPANGHTAAVVAGKEEAVPAGSRHVQKAIQGDHNPLINAGKLEDVKAADRASAIRLAQGVDFGNRIHEGSPGTSLKGDHIGHRHIPFQTAHKGRHEMPPLVVWERHRRHAASWMALQRVGKEGIEGCWRPAGGDVAKRPLVGKRGRAIERSMADLAAHPGVEPAALVSPGGTPAGHARRIESRRGRQKVGQRLDGG